MKKITRNGNRAAAQARISVSYVGNRLMCQEPGSTPAAQIASGRCGISLKRALKDRSGRISRKDEQL